MIDMPDPRFTPVGENALLVEYAPEISLGINRQVQRLSHALERAAIPGVTEIITAYRSLMVYFDTEAITLLAVEAAVAKCASESAGIALPPPRLFSIPTIYGGKYGPDLPYVAATTGLAPEAVVKLFSGQQFPVYCLGFLCSLAYLGGVPTQLQLPRRTTPRTFVHAGSVGIAGGQALALPIDMPSGFHYLGRTFVSLYDPTRMPPTEIRVGDLVKFPAVYPDAGGMVADH